MSLRAGWWRSPCRRRHASTSMRACCTHSPPTRRTQRCCHAWCIMPMRQGTHRASFATRRSPARKPRAGVRTGKAPRSIGRHCATPMASACVTRRCSSRSSRGSRDCRVAGKRRSKQMRALSRSGAARAIRLHRESTGARDSECCFSASPGGDARGHRRDCQCCDQEGTGNQGRAHVIRARCPHCCGEHATRARCSPPARNRSIRRSHPQGQHLASMTSGRSGIVCALQGPVTSRPCLPAPSTPK